MGVLFLMVGEEKSGGVAWQRDGVRPTRKGVDVAMRIMITSGTKPICLKFARESRKK
jgi:hypothetical protein